MKVNSKRKLSLLDSISIIIGVIIGAGLFETAPAIASSCSSWKEVLFLWALGGFFSLCGALVYAELSTTFPEDGGEIIYLRQTFGETFSYLFAWGRFVIIQPGSIAAMSFVFVSYLKSAVDGLGVSLDLENYFLACVLVILITLINITHNSLVISLQNLLSFSIVLILIIIFSTVFVLPDVFVAFSTLENEPYLTDQGNTLPLGVALVLVLFTYGGWSELALVASEVKKPEKNISKALVYGVLLVSILYIGINACFLLILGHKGVVESNAVVADTLSTVFPSYSGVVVSITICVCVLASIQAMTYTGARLNAALGRDFAGFAFLAKKEDKEISFFLPLLTQGTMSLFIIFLMQSFSGTVMYTSTIVWFFFFLTSLSFIYLRITKANLERPFMTPFAPCVSLLFSLSSAYLLWSALSYNLLGSIFSALFLLAGLPVRFVMKNYSNKVHRNKR